jgi:hypothetical protein
MMVNCDHKCHKEGSHLNPWIEVCPVCGCLNEHYDPEAAIPKWMDEWRKSIGEPR